MRCYPRVSAPLFCLFLVTTVTSMLPAQQEVVIYDEAKVPQFTLPDPLVGPNGEKIETAEAWNSKQRPYLIQLFETQVYGKAPAAPGKISYKVTESSDEAFGGKARRRQVAIQLTDDPEGPVLNLLVYLPKTDKPVPTFLMLSFYGNATVTDDPAVMLPTSWLRDNKDKGISGHKASEKMRGTSSGRWPIETILDRGYGVATAYYGDIDPDFDDGFQNGIHPYFNAEGQTKPKADEWGSIAAWSWGMSRALDYLQESEEVDGEKVISLGHSRLGKTALWAGATDTRFAAVISNNSGCGGAALSRRRYGESVQKINKSFPHWFCDNFVQYSHNEDACPVDQHELIALIAPRPCLICSAEEDRWADPHGEFLSGHYASPVYELLGVEGMGVEKMPAINEPVLSRLGYVIRPGKHDVTTLDWQRYMDFADRHVTKAAD
ncbi:acetylxylan esterase [Bremerella cremea]|uniref:glucuronyl esterase domain-containing protein n=1 Tax=Bremerella cremea TaxID=1031537 RepID=UPI0031EFE252